MEDVDKMDEIVWQEHVNKLGRGFFIGIGMFIAIVVLICIVYEILK